VTLLLWLVSSAHAAPPIGPVPIVVPAAPAVHLTVKFRDAVTARANAGAITMPTLVDRSELDAVVATWHLTFSPLVHIDPARIEALRARAAARTGQPAADLQGLFRVDVPDDDSATLLAVAEALQAVDAVEYVHLSGSGWEPPGDIAPATDDWSDLQEWQGPDPGIDAAYALARGVRGANVGLADCEYDWNAAHEDLVDVDLGREPGERSPGYTEDYEFDQHGTAAIGMLVAGDNGYGALGAAPDVGVTTWPEDSVQEGSRRVSAIADAVAAAAPGDVVMLEMQAVYRPGGDYGPAEVDPDVFEVVRTATDAGVIVVAAAGNGAEDLDSRWYQDNWLDWGDSGAILVGAGMPDTTHDTLYFSSYGERVNVQGWGMNVFTLGYGDVYEPGNDIDQAYTYFSGTSSATPMVAAAIVLLQDFRVSHGLPPSDAWEMRDLLVATGHAQDDADPIGPLPDVAAAIRSLDADEDDHVAVSAGGDDCDDTDPDVFPGSPAPDTVRIDRNCDGVFKEAEKAGCGCAAGGSGGELWGVLGMVGLVGRRRRGRTAG
jgi:MYXO-CTERM domain-containing protein